MNREHAARRRLGVGALGALAIALAAPAGSATRSGEDVKWPTVNGTLDGERYSPLMQIDTTNVKGLKVAWRFRVKTLGAGRAPSRRSTSRRARSAGRSTSPSR